MDKEKANLNVPAAPLLWSVKQVAFHCGLSVRSIWRAEAAGLLPPSLLLLSSRRWLATDIQRWARLGCPDKRRFLLLEKDGRG